MAYPAETVKLDISIHISSLKVIKSMWKTLSFIAALSILIIPNTASAYGEGCLAIGAPSSSALTSNSTYAEHSWKVSITNSCPEPLEATVTYKVLNSNGFELDDDIVFGVIVSSNRTVLVREIMLISPTSNANLISTSSVSLTSRSYTATLAEQCLRIGSGVFRSLDTNSTYTDVSLKTAIINDCATSFESTVYFNFYDTNGFLIDYGLETSIFTPALGTGVARTNILLSSELVPRFATAEATLSNQRDTTTPNYLDVGEWLTSASSTFDASTGILSTSASIDGRDSIAMNLSLLESNQFQIDLSSLANLTSLPAGAAQFHSNDGSLRIPRLGITNYSGIDNLENVVLKLDDATNYTFDLTSFTDERSPNNTARVDGADTCINIGNLDYVKLTENSIYSEISWKADVSNSCAQAYNSTFYFLVHDDNDIVLESDLETNVSYPSQSTSTITGTLLLSPSLAADIAKLSARVRIR